MNRPTFPSDCPARLVFRKLAVRGLAVPVDWLYRAKQLIRYARLARNVFEADVSITTSVVPTVPLLTFDSVLTRMPRPKSVSSGPAVNVELERTLAGVARKCVVTFDR